MKTYTFWGRTAEGQTVKRQIDAPNMRAAVAAFMSQTDRPAVMGWHVRTGSLSTARGPSHRVTYARWGSAYCGNAKPETKP